MASTFLKLRVISQRQLQPKRLKSTAWPPEALRRKFEKFQTDDGIPMYLKDGFGDRMLYLTTFALAIIGTVSGLSTLLSMAFKKKT